MKSKDGVWVSHSRRKFLATGGRLLLFAPLASLVPLPACGGSKPQGSSFVATRPPAVYTGSDDQLLEEIERAAFAFFWEQAHPQTGFVKDRARTGGNDSRTVASIAATGFGLTALCIGDSRAYRSTSEIRDRTARTLQSVLGTWSGNNGFYYHFVDWQTGQRVWNCELSSIDSCILLCGVLTARQHFPKDAQIVDLCNRIYRQMQWTWMLNGSTTLSMGWKPESGFLDNRWDHYCELMMLYLLGMGSPTYPLSADTWKAWTRPTYTYQGLTYISGGDPLFTHQYSQAWFDFRNKRDAFADYFQNSVTATQAHKMFCLSLSSKYPAYADDQWGISSSDSKRGYIAWGGPPSMGPIDGTIVPCAAAGSVAFTPDICMPALRRMRMVNGVWGRYGYTDAYHPANGWINPDVIGIDVGIAMLMAENQRTGFVWNTFMSCPEVQQGMNAAGFQPTQARQQRPAVRTGSLVPTRASVAHQSQTQ